MNCYSGTIKWVVSDTTILIRQMRMYMNCYSGTIKWVVSDTTI